MFDLSLECEEPYVTQGIPNDELIVLDIYGGCIDIKEVGVDALVIFPYLQGVVLGHGNDSGLIHIDVVDCLVMAFK